jgi:hypothetical protein
MTPKPKQRNSGDLRLRDFVSREKFQAHALQIPFDEKHAQFSEYAMQSAFVSATRVAQILAFKL